jgi:hypothetical protein
MQPLLAQQLELRLVRLQEQARPLRVQQQL